MGLGHACSFHVSGQMAGKTLQIATFGEDEDAVLVGIRNFPVHRLELICYPRDRERADRFTANIRSVLGIPISIHVTAEHDLMQVLEIVVEIIQRERANYADVIMNVGAGDKYLTCSATSAAFFNGLKAFGVLGDTPMMLPIIKMSYNELVSAAKLEILAAISHAGGEVESLEQLSKLADYGKPLLSYHIQGAEDSRGLVKLGLVEVERIKRGKTKVKLTSLGKMLLLSTKT